MNKTFVYQRLAHGEDSSYGVLYDPEGVQQCFIVEDEPREVKVDGETRIHKGKYLLKQRKVLSGMTKRYREKYDWFKWHLELQDVPDFEYVYLHIGNFERNSEGCLLCNYNIVTSGKEYYGGNSTQAFKDFYEKVNKLLEEGYEVYVDIRDESFVLEPF
tara:strand:- start:110453 stop:110929 length:477 start_codon:yes stop_codon:yes gene_type:complete